MKSGFLLNYYKNKNENNLSKLIKIVPKELKNLIVDYKYKFDHNLKIQELNKEFFLQKYECACCETNKFENICPILFTCKSCQRRVCEDCVDCCHNDEELQLCSGCHILIDVFYLSTCLIGRDLTHEEEEEIVDYYMELEHEGNWEELMVVLEVLKEYRIDMPEEDEMEPNLYTYEEYRQELRNIVSSILEEEAEFLNEEVEELD